MQYVATLHIWDAFESVTIQARVIAYDGSLVAGAADPVYLSAQVKGRGEEQLERWLRDALVAMAETL